MKQLTIIERLPHGAIFIQLPCNFRVDISIDNDMVFMDFKDEKSTEVVYTTFFFIDHDGCKSFDDFSQRGQELLLERLCEVIVSDISTFIGGKYEGVAYPDEPYHSLGGCFDIVPYMDYWTACYDLISDDEDILEEYTDPEENTDE